MNTAFMTSTVGFLTVAALSAQSPPPANVFKGFVVGPDPQVAAGNTHLVTANTGALAFWDKATLANLPGLYNGAGSLFASTLPVINPGRLNFPPADSVACDPNNIYRPFNPSDPLHTVEGCVNEFYDTRLHFDRPRNRFWIASAARNQIWKCTVPGTTTAGGKTNTTLDPSQKCYPELADLARRFIVVAVSKTEDPTGEYYKYVLVSRYHDWPLMAVNDDRLVLGHNGDNQIFVYDADLLAAGNPGHLNLSLGKIVFNSNTTAVYPVVLRSTSNGLSFLVGIRSNLVDIWAFQRSGTSIQLFSPGTVNVGSSISFKVNPVYRGGTVYMASNNSCATPFDNPCRNRIRINSMDVTGPVNNTMSATLKIDHIVGSVSDVHAYQLPALDVSANKNIVVVYDRVGFDTTSDSFPQARYNVWYSGESTPRASAQLHAGKSMPCEDPSHWQVDFGNTSIDGLNDGQIWMSHAYANNQQEGHQCTTGGPIVQSTGYTQVTGSVTP
jgi:hypothetical protein